jgi:hypothetical protein
VAQRVGRGIALLFHDHDNRRGGVVSSTPRPYFTPRKDPVPTVQEAGWAPGPVWTGAENLASTGIRSPDRPARRSVAIPTELPGPHLDLGSTLITTVSTIQPAYGVSGGTEEVLLSPSAL